MLLLQFEIRKFSRMYLEFIRTARIFENETQETEKVSFYTCETEGVLDQTRCFAAGSWSMVKVYLGHV